MATQLDREKRARGQDKRRSRLTLDIDADLHARLKIAAVQAGIPMREYVEELFEAALPKQESETLMERKPISRDVLRWLPQARKAISRGRTLSDSAEIVRSMREERTEHLDEL